MLASGRTLIISVSSQSSPSFTSSEVLCWKPPSGVLGRPPSNSQPVHSLATERYFSLPRYSPRYVRARMGAIVFTFVPGSPNAILSS